MKKFFLFLSTIILILGCQKKLTQNPVTKKPLILVSVEPYVEMVQQIAGNTVDVISIIPSDADPHTWEPTIGQMSRLHNARYWFTIGEPVENSVFKKLKEINPDLEQVSLYKGIQRLLEPSSHCSHCFDTHMWLSPKTASLQADIIYQTLAKHDPKSKNFYNTSLLRLKKQLYQLDAKCRITLKPFANKILLTSHGSYTYFCKDYHLKQYVIEPTSGREPRAKDITQLIKKLKRDQEDIIGVFTQPQHTNKAANLIAKQLNLPLYTIDPLQKNYIQTIENLTKAIVSDKS